MTAELESGRFITINGFNYDVPYMMILSIPTKNQIINCSYDFWKYHYREMTEFFKTGKEPISHKETLIIAAAREAGKKTLPQTANGLRLITTTDKHTAKCVIYSANKSNTI